MYGWSFTVFKFNQFNKDFFPLIWLTLFKCSYLKYCESCGNISKSFYLLDFIDCLVTVC